MSADRHPEEERERQDADQPTPRHCRYCGVGRFVLIAETPRPTVAQLMQMPPSMEPPAESRYVQWHRHSPPSRERRTREAIDRWPSREDGGTLSAGLTPGALVVRRRTTLEVVKRRVPIPVLSENRVSLRLSRRLRIQSTPIRSL